MSQRDPSAAIRARFPGVVRVVDGGGGEPALELPAAHLTEVCEFLRDEGEARYDLLLTVTSTGDQVCYPLVSARHGRRLLLRVPTPRQPLALDSLSFVWPAANWAERQARDLWGTAFRGHPDLRPLLAGAGRASRVPAAPPDGTLLSARTLYPSSMDGLFVRLHVDGECVVQAEPDLGYRRAGMEQQLARWPYERGTLLAARLDGFSAMHGDLAYALAVEKLLQVEPPPRAQRLRVIYAELQRIASHLFWLIRSVQRLADPLFAAPAYAWAARTMILDLFQSLGGNPITPDLIAVGGLRCDVPAGFGGRLSAMLGDLQALLDDVAFLLERSAVLQESLEGLGVIDPGTALGLGVTGPCLRASGIPYDVRTTFPYSGYESLDVQVPVERAGDAGARCRVRVAEMQASLDLCRQAGSSLPAGSANAFGPDAPDRVRPALPPGAVYASVEGPRGELGFYLVAGGPSHLRHAHVRGPSLANLSMLPLVSPGLTPAQVAGVLDSLDISIAEAER